MPELTVHHGSSSSDSSSHDSSQSLDRIQELSLHNGEKTVKQLGVEKNPSDVCYIHGNGSVVRHLAKKTFEKKVKESHNSSSVNKRKSHKRGQ